MHILKTVKIALSYKNIKLFRMKNRSKFKFNNFTSKMSLADMLTQVRFPPVIYNSRTNHI